MNKIVLDFFKSALSDTGEHERQKNYKERNNRIIDALGLCPYVNIKAGIRIDSEEPEWPVVFIELPTGQVSWHVPQHDVPWDGHTTEEKYQRIKEFCEQ